MYKIHQDCSKVNEIVVLYKSKKIVMYIIIVLKMPIFQYFAVSIGPTRGSENFQTSYTEGGYHESVSMFLSSLT